MKLGLTTPFFQLNWTNLNTFSFNHQIMYYSLKQNIPDEIERILILPFYIVSKLINLY